APLLREGGFVYLEAPRAFDAPPAGWALHRHGRAGAVHHHLLRRYTGPNPDCRSEP
ncbi:MAG: hypothetical protein HXY24_07780, partial [Rubrivivax sp.]|nr:hypothetical protein [Rubrivivax sp.]